MDNAWNDNTSGLNPKQVRSLIGVTARRASRDREVAELKHTSHDTPSRARLGHDESTRPPYPGGCVCEKLF